MATYLTHKVVNIDAVKVKQRKTLEEYERTYEANAKYDGCFAFVHLHDDGKFNVSSRTGEVVTSMNRQALALSELLAQEVRFYEGLVILAEAWSPTLPFNVINGRFRRTDQQAVDLQFMVFDCLTKSEFLSGCSEVPFCIRMGRLHNKLAMPLRGRINPDVNATRVLAQRAERWPPGTYDALHLCEKLVDDPRGFDGLVMADPDGLWVAGRGTTGEKVRLKRNLSFDLRVTARHKGVGEKTGRDVWTISVDYQGKELRVGSGMPHDEASVPKVGDIVEIHAMDYSSDGLLREPRYKGVRFDKTEPDT